MDAKTINSGFDELIKDGADLKTTVMDFGEAKIQRVKKNDLSILTVTGIYSRALGKELERICLGCQGNLGLELTNIQVNPALRKKFDSSIVGVLRNIRDAFRNRKMQLLLCTPPSELVDLLKLTGVYDGYQVVEKPSAAVLASDLKPADAQTEMQPSTTEGPGGFVQKKLVQFNQSLKRTASLEKGLESAEKCVKRFLPQAPPVAEGYGFAFWYKSSEKVGGDFFDFIPLSGDKLGLLVGDVSGHGLDAAILMGITKKVINLRARAAEGIPPREVLRQVNTDLTGDFNKYNFVTALYGVLDLPTGLFTFARAGHEMPIVFHPGRAPSFIDSKGVPIGIGSARTFNQILEERRVEMPPGSFLLLLTDGLSECWSPRGEAYSRERLLYTLSQVKSNMACEKVLDLLLKSIADFAGDRPQEDDMTAILVKRLD